MMKSSRNKILFTARALKDLQKIDKDTQKRIGSRLKEYAIEPLKHARKLTDDKIGTYRFRIGDYRVIFDLNNSDIVILKIGHHRDIHK